MGGLYGCTQSWQRRETTCCTIALCIRRIDAIKQIAVGGDHADLGVPVSDSTVYQWDAPAVASVGKDPPCVNIVQSIQNQIAVTEQINAIFFSYELGDSGDCDGWIDDCGPMSGGVGFCHADVIFCAKKLTVEIGAVECVAVSSDDPANTHAEHMFHEMSAQAAQTGNEYGFGG